MAHANVFAASFLRIIVLVPQITFLPNDAQHSEGSHEDEVQDELPRERACIPCLDLRVDCEFVGISSDHERAAAYQEVWAENSRRNNDGMVLKPQSKQSTQDEECSHHDPEKHVTCNVVKEEVIEEETTDCSRPPTKEEEADFDALHKEKSEEDTEDNTDSKYNPADPSLRVISYDQPEGDHESK